MTSQSIPVVCDMTDAPDNLEERLAEYRHLFGNDLMDRERTASGIRFRFRARDGLAAEVRDLAAREKACCAFFEFEVHDHGAEITWDGSVIDDPVARQILDEFYELPVTLTGDIATVYRRFTDSGLPVMVDDNGTTRPATEADLGIA